MSKAKKAVIFCITLLIITIVGLIYFYSEKTVINKKYIKLDNDHKILKQNYSKLEVKNLDLLKENKLLMDNNPDFKSLEKEKIEYKEKISILEKENISLKDQLSKVIERNEIKLTSSVKVVSMNIGSWVLTDKEKEYVKSMLTSDKSFYEIIPIVDNRNYKNDPHELKQLGLSRKRAALAITILRMLNPENKIFISTEVMVSENGERGFVINQYK